MVWMVRRDMTDLDNDGYEAWSDCNDSDPSIHPLAGDTYGDGVDSDCDEPDCEADFDGNGVYFNVWILSSWIKQKLRPLQRRNMTGSPCS